MEEDSLDILLEVDTLAVDILPEAGTLAVGGSLGLDKVAAGGTLEQEDKYQHEVEQPVVQMAHMVVELQLALLVDNLVDMPCFQCMILEAAK